MKKAILLALAVSATSFSAFAGESELSYNNVEFGYAQNKIDTNASGPGFSIQDTRPKGYYLNGSIELGETPFYVFGGYAKGNDRITSHIYEERVRWRSSAKTYNVGLGYHYAINSRVNLLAETSYLNSRGDMNSDGFRIRERGNDLRFAFGVDAMLTDRLEGWAKTTYTNGHSSSTTERITPRQVYEEDMVSHSSFGAQLGMQFKFNKNWGITGQGNFSKGNSGYQVGVRASF